MEEEEGEEDLVVVVGVVVVMWVEGMVDLEEGEEDDEDDDEEVVEEKDGRLDGLPVLVWGIVREAWSTTACFDHKHVERRGQDRGSGGTWGSPGAWLREGVLRGWWCAAGLRGRSWAWVRLCRLRLLGAV